MHRQDRSGSIRPSLGIFGASPCHCFILFYMPQRTTRLTTWTKSPTLPADTPSVAMPLSVEHWTWGFVAGDRANFSLFMVTVSRLLCDRMEGLSEGSMLDLKTVFSARKCTWRILNSLGKTGEEFLIDDRIIQAAEIGRIHAKSA